MTLVTIGTTHGLTRSSSNEESEQVYVKLNHDDPRRPVVIEGWKGYAIPQRLRLTKRQAKELVQVLVEAITVEGLE